VAGYSGARALLRAAGIEVVEAREARTLDEVVVGAAALGYPVVLKAVDLLHKSDSGGVALGLDDPESLTSAFAAIRARHPDSTLSVERLAPVADGVELIAGAIRDPRFGPIVLVGLGGIYAEILRDTAVALAPLGEDAAEALIRSLRGAPLLTGARGRAKLDLAAAARVVAAISDVAAACDDVDEIEVNPLLVTSTGALALDARILLLGVESPG
jgi:succinyl-CoA synthetase beta subunit